MSPLLPWNKRLSHRQVQLLCLLALAVHLLPLVLADYAYIDDVWRAQNAGLTPTGNESWTGQGRFLLYLMHRMLGFSVGAVNLFPLPILLAASVTALALARLVSHYFPAPTATSVLVVLPLWYNPFFLQNLSYQYDAPGMALALAACVWAITLSAERWQQCLLGGVLVACAASFYQVSINVFAGLCCLEIMRQVLGHAGLRQVCRHLFGRLTQLLGGCLLYSLTAHQFIDVPRTALLPLDAQWWPEVLRRLEVILGHVALLITPGTAWVFIGLSGLALVALLIALREVLVDPRPVWERGVLTAALLLPIPAVALLVYGLMMVFAHFDGGARLLMGFGVVLMMLALLAHRLLSGLGGRLRWLLAIPVLFMLSFSFAYGRTLIVQKELQRMVTSSLANAIQSRPQLYETKRFYVLDIGSSARWLPAASASYEQMPALRYVLNIDFLMLPEMMPRLGLVNFTTNPPLDREQVLARSHAAVVKSTFFDIHLVDGNGYVLMKAPAQSEAYRW
ncbi:glucosyltransferase domain-containing protein [Pseudomonas sp. M5]|uniref:glucosyltransferase domain-containing protein n=1 Tax=Pseudomonas sp. M5 TaxID=1620788 RepID=UPI001958C882|nr:glucosyltransferase domain-containing protein [Pseudomonas sp. M5]MBM7399352.1 hypothetical protein [Pseudomonas sp. M5]HDS1756583.1 glucosyltransferase domain-containing protein [Pseudomonas putida]